MNVRYELKRVGILSAGLVIGLISALLALVLALIMAVFFLIMMAAGVSAATTEGSPPEAPMAMFGGAVGMLLVAIVAPLAYGAAGFIFGCLYAAIYNLVAKLTGGVELELRQKNDLIYSQLPPSQP